MRSRRSLPIAVVVVLVLTGIAWIAWPRARPPSAIAPGAGDAATSEPRAGEAMRLSDRVAADPLATREIANVDDAGEDAPLDASTDAPAGEIALLRVLAIDENDRSSRSGVRVAAVPDDAVAEGVDGPRGGVGEAPITGADGRAQVQVLANVELTLCAHDETHGFFVTRPVEPFIAGEEREIVVDFPSTAPDRMVHGQLVDADSGDGVAGVVRVFDSGIGSVLMTDAMEKPDVATDGAGRFTLHVRSWREPSATAEASGYARTVFRLDRAHEDPGRPLHVRLPRGATIVAHVHDAAGTPIPGASVLLSADPYKLQPPSDERMASFEFVDEHWAATTDAGGVAQVEGLVPNLPYEVVISADGWPERREAEPLVLAPGERRTLDIVLGAGAAIVGSLLDEGGAPIAQHVVWRIQVPDDAVTLFHAYLEPVATAVTDASGHFRFDAVPRGPWLVGPAPEQPSGATDVPARATRVHVDAEDGEVPVVIRVSRGLSISGRVLDPDGAPAADAGVLAFADGAIVQASCDASGEFAIGPLLQGAWLLWAESRERGSSERVPVHAGASGTVLRLSAFGQLRGEVVDAGTGAPLACDVIVTGSDPLYWSGAPSSDGRFERESLPAGTYAVIASTSDGRIGVLHEVHVASGSRTDGARVEVGPGARLRVRFDASAGEAHGALWHEGHFVDWLTVPANAPLVRLVPPGTLEVRWSTEVTGEFPHVERAEHVRAGDDVEIVLRESGAR